MSSANTCEAADSESNFCSMKNLLLDKVALNIGKMLSLPRAIAGLFPSSAGRNVAFRIKNVRLSSSEVTTQEPSDGIMDEAELRAAELEAKRNKSRLKATHYSMVHRTLPVDINNPEFDYQKSLKYQQKLAARYGTSSGINLGIAWPTKQVLNNMIEYESVAYPFTLQEMIEKKRIEKEEQRKKLIARFCH